MESIKNTQDKIVELLQLKTSNELLVGDILIDINKNEIEIISVNILYESQQVYNITVDKEHMYFANNILTHNKQAPPPQ